MAQGNAQSPSTGQSRRERQSTGVEAFGPHRANTGQIRTLVDLNLRARIASLDARLAALDGLTNGGDR